jgi:NACalpha-BTF3-like transcription factor
MMTVAQITKVLPHLSTVELQRVERTIIVIYRKRKQGLIFDDAYGTFSEMDQAALVDEAFQELDRAEQQRKQTKRQRRACADPSP